MSQATINTIKSWRDIPEHFANLINQAFQNGRRSRDEEVKRLRGFCGDGAIKEIERLKDKVKILVSQQKELMRDQSRLCRENFDCRVMIGETGKKIESLFEAIKHGDEAHQQWLKDAIARHFAEQAKAGE